MPKLSEWPKGSQWSAPPPTPLPSFPSEPLSHPSRTLGSSHPKYGFTSKTLCLAFALPRMYSLPKSYGLLSRPLLKFHLISRNFTKRDGLTSSPGTPFPLVLALFFSVALIYVLTIQLISSLCSALLLSSPIHVDLMTSHLS